MKPGRSTLSILVATVVLAAAVLAAQGTARIAILAIGGTIAGAGDASGYGYKAG